MDYAGMTRNKGGGLEDMCYRSGQGAPDWGADWSQGHGFRIILPIPGPAMPAPRISQTLWDRS